MPLDMDRLHPDPDGRTAFGARGTAPPVSGTLVALAPTAGFFLLLSLISRVLREGSIRVSIPWIPALDLSFAIYLDAFALVFALLVTGIGALVTVYAGFYAKGERGAWRLLLYLQIFLVSMLGMVISGNLIQLFVFWEATSIASYLLIGYKTADSKARAGALKSLLLTGSGGIALLVAFLMMGAVTGSFELPSILASGDRLRESPLYLAMLILLAAGAFTKSAQIPFHIWLPDGMAAPTPASAFLHSATMVKAGIYLLARLNPVMGLTEAWFWLLTITGLATMLVGAYLGMRQRDLKRLLAYSTVSQLGVTVMLLGQDTAVAFKAAVISILAHSLYKSALFMIAGIVDHAAGTRDLQRLGGLWRSMPRTAAVAALAALSMAGLPPMFGFLAKETLISTAIHPTLPASLSLILTGSVVVAGAMILTQAGTLLLGTFAGRRRDRSAAVHDPPLPMVLAALVPAVASLLLALLPNAGTAALLASAASAAYGSAVKVSLAIWTGLGVPVFLSAVAVGLGLAAIRFAAQVRRVQDGIDPGPVVDRIYGASIKAVDVVAAAAGRIQQGRLRLYLTIMISVVVVVFVLIARPIVPRMEAGAPAADLWTMLRLFAMLLAVSAAVATVLLRRDLHAILAMGALGLNVAVLFLLEPAPDVALAMIVVDVLTVVILVLSLTKLPAEIRRRADSIDFRERILEKTGEALIAASAGAVVTIAAWVALAGRPRPSAVASTYMEQAKPLTGARDVVGAIVIDFRGFDTMIEICVFALAGVGVYSLLRRSDAAGGGAIDRGSRSAFLHALAFILLPLCLVLAAVFMMYGHDRPGDGFVAGVIVALAVAFWYAVFGTERSRRTLRWVRPLPMAAAGISLALLQAGISYAANGAFFSPFDFGRRLGIPLPEGFALTTSFLMEAAIFFAVLGGAGLIIDSVGHPDDSEPAVPGSEGA